MKIYTPKGDKVIYTGKGGYTSDKERGDKYLKQGETYTVHKTVVHSFSTDVYLEEIQDTFPNGGRVYFNSVLFRNIIEEESEAEYIDRVKPNLGDLLIHKTKQKKGTIENMVDELERIKHKEITGWDTPEERAAYDKGREDEEKVIIKFITKWDGKTNSGMGELLKVVCDFHSDREWIKCSEQQPPKDGDYLVTFPNPTGAWEVIEMHWYGEDDGSGQWSKNNPQTWEEPVYWRHKPLLPFKEVPYVDQF